MSKKPRVDGTPPQNDDLAEQPKKASRPRGRPRGVSGKRRAGDLDTWAQEIYSAPPGARDGSDSVDARVVVSTRIRKPKVHLMAPATVPWVELPRYMGRWYEIARLPYFTQRFCVKDVYAEYALGDDGMMYVINRCTRKGGRIGQAKALARVVDPASNSRFEISFRTLYGVHVLWDDYWVLGLGEDYDYALVGQPTRRRGWVLSREPCPPEAKVQQWLGEFAEKGFPAQDFIRTLQEPSAED
ncbi:MAG: lipocalin family protein [Thiohalocapsa sp.]